MATDVGAVPPRRGTRVRRGSAPGLLRDAARELFAERGYQATTRDIAERAGVSPDLIYRYFDTKANLFAEAVVNPFLDGVSAMHRGWLDDPKLQAMDLQQLVRRFTVGFYAYMSENALAARALLHLFSESSTEGELEELRQKIGDTVKLMTEPIDGYLAAQGVRAAPPALQLRTVLLLVGIVVTALPNTYATDDAMPPQSAILDELSQFIYHGLRGAEIVSSPARRGP